VRKAKELGYHSKVISAGRTINDYMPKHVFNLLTDALNDNEKSVKNSKIVVLGLSYKENVGDDRESPSEELILQLKNNQAIITMVDPYIDESSLGIVEKDVYKALEGADAVILMTAHDEFRNLNLKTLKNLMKTPLLIDGRRVYDPEQCRKIGFQYYGVGAVNKSYLSI